MLTLDLQLDFLAVLVHVDGGEQVSAKAESTKEWSGIESHLQALESVEIRVRLGLSNGIAYLEGGKTEKLMMSLLVQYGRKCSFTLDVRLTNPMT